jgi:tRNA A37 threonylcarbamoyladenosine dehydratase
MLHKLIDHSPDLKKLRDEGFEVQIKGTLLMVSGVPYLNSEKKVRKGTLVKALTIAGEKVGQPNDHVINFIGDHPCNKDGSIMTQLTHSNVNNTLGDGIIINRSFSHKPGRNYHDYHEMFTTYIGVISAPVRSLDYSITAQTYNLVESEQSDSVFQYPDTNSSRAEIDAVSNKLKDLKIGIIGNGGTGSYVLDFVAKTPVAEIHIFDDDKFLLHNAFRTPGAPSSTQLKRPSKKVAYLHKIYSKMHKHIVPHDEYLHEGNLEQLSQLDYVFICIDKGEIKRLLIEFFKANKVSFTDVGMGILVTDDNTIIGQIRVTSAFNGEVDQILEKGRISLSDGDPDDDYNKNIQIAELNALNAALAVMKWKTYYGFYGNVENEDNSVFIIEDNSIINEDA